MTKCFQKFCIKTSHRNKRTSVRTFVPLSWNGTQKNQSNSQLSSLVMKHGPYSMSRYWSVNLGETLSRKNEKTNLQVRTEAMVIFLFGYQECDHD